MSLDLALVRAELPEIVAALWVTLAIWAGAVAAGSALGFLVALGRAFGPSLLGAALRLPVEVIRGTPFLVQIFLLYFGGPEIGLRLEPVPAGLIGLSVYAAAYFSEIFRAGFRAVPRGHVEAARSLGLSPAQIVRRILVPEMTTLVLPQGVNLAIVLVKETAVLSVITVPEVTLVVGAIGSQQYAFAESLFLLAVFYWLVVEAAGWLGRRAERRLARFRFS